MSTSEFSKLLSKRYDAEHELLFHRLEWDDKIVLNIQVNGLMDTTFDIPVSTKAAVNSIHRIESEDELNIEPVILVGNHQNLKIQVVAAQIGKLVFQLENPKNVILSIGSRWFGKGDESAPDDFEKLVFVLAGVKEVLA